MPKNTTAYTTLKLVITSFMSIENMNVETLRFTKIRLAKSFLNEFKKVHSLNLDVAKTNNQFLTEGFLLLNRRIFTDLKNT